MSLNLSIANNTKGKLPSLPLAVLKKDILGEKYVLSIAFVTKAKSHEINKAYRGKDKPTNVLSFELSKTQGELILCPSLIKEESKDPEKNFGKDFRKLLGYLVIHGMLHLKGMQHSSKMDKAEAKYDKKYFYRDRRGIKHHKSSGGRISKRRKIS